MRVLFVARTIETRDSENGIIIQIFEMKPPKDDYYRYFLPLRTLYQTDHKTNFLRCPTRQ